LINPNSNRKLEIRGSQEDGFFVDNLFATYIETMDEILTILQEGDYNRSTASHMLNEHSSRSHAILTIQVENELQNSDDPKEQITKLGKLIFVDLAGSEKVKVSMSKGKQLVETNNINKSLLVLGNCISALSDPNKKDGHIPYRDSKLTKLLSESLGGTGITLMIACVSPSNTCESETLNTLRYANRAQNIENVPLMKSDSRENIIQKLKRELRKLKEENHTLKTQLGLSGVGASSSNNALASSGTGLNTSTSNSGSGRILPRIVRNGSSHSNASNDSSLYSKLQEYINENRSLKTENSQLEKLREKVRKQHEVLTRENEKLARKLEQVLRDKGQNVQIVSSNPGEFVMLNQNGGKVVKTQLPPIDTRQQQQLEVLSVGSSTNNSRNPSPNKKIQNQKITYSDPGSDSVVE
jgi:kinesin family protein 12